MGFGDSVRRASERMQKEVNDKTILIATDLFKTIISKTPIGTSDTKGQLINNWNVGFGVGKYVQSTTKSYNTSGIRSYNEVAKLKTSKEFLSKDGEVSFTNAVHYAYRAEYAGWPQPQWSGQVLPYAMVRNSLTEVAAKYK